MQRVGAGSGKVCSVKAVKKWIASSGKFGQVRAVEVRHVRVRTGLVTCVASGFCGLGTSGSVVTSSGSFRYGGQGGPDGVWFVMESRGLKSRGGHG